ncbi:MAG: urease accessory protein UreD [Verrucomicrobia bacterium]|nr:urease accessory protein UreD [Verrucomicrobiota bacterium]
MNALAGHLDVACAVRDDGATYVSRQSHAAPFHFSKPYWDGEVLTVQAVNATPGLFGGDRLRCHVEAGPGARVRLTSPSAQRAHTMPHGCAIVEQDFQVAAGGWLEVRPEWFIPQAGSRCTLTTRLDVAAGGEAWLVEAVAPGRVARGEALAFEELTWSLDLLYDGQWLVGERYTLRGGDDSLWPLRRIFDPAYYASVFLVSPRLGALADEIRAVTALNAPCLWAGISRLRGPGWCVKLLAADAVTLRAALDQLRAIFAGRLPSLGAALRRV